MPALATLLIPLIPGLVNNIIAMVDAISGHDSTPAATKAHLDGISVDLKALVIKVEAVQLPN